MSTLIIVWYYPYGESGRAIRYTFTSPLLAWFMIERSLNLQPTIEERMRQVTILSEPGIRKYTREVHPKVAVVEIFRVGLN